VSLATLPGQVGERWVVRHRLADGSATDVTGWLEELTPHRIRLRLLRGGEAAVDPATLIGARRVSIAYGGPDPRRTSAEELEQVAARAWVAEWEPLGEWTLRAGGGFTGRANSCLAVGDPGLSLASAAERVVAYAKGHGIEPRIQVVAGSETEQGLRELGWVETYVRTTVLVTRLSTWLGEEAPYGRADVIDSWTPEWGSAYGRSRPTPADPELVRRILTSAAPRAFAQVAGPDELVAIGRGQVTRGWLGLSSVWTDPEWRRQGLATAVMRALGHWAARLGARSAYLQVASENADAVQAYQRLGFQPHHDYRYLRPAA